jgi:hypothetical protein
MSLYTVGCWLTTQLPIIPNDYDYDYYKPNAHIKYELKIQIAMKYNNIPIKTTTKQQI